MFGLSLSENNKNPMGIIERQIEAILFVSPQPVSSFELSSGIGISQKRVEEAIEILKSVYTGVHGITILSLAGGWQMTTAPDLADIVESFLSLVTAQKIRLSKAALETLSVIAYNQPVTRSEIEDIRSVRCDRVVDTLLKHGLVRIAGRKKSVGSPLLFRTTDRFLEIFGLSGINCLPSLEDLKENTETQNDMPFAVKEEDERKYGYEDE